ncbi:TonB-dependent receptor [Flavobacterium sp. HJJ]|uniref:TonB-dependent receptor n=1 Tax=Flavobacterium sp. HJJ TaxID=2783792 RepID=UPI00188B8855|nr:TonB-dependent receptor [Flavobacterium sp. HJJ]MBF4470625.1 TonB-dependent receptor [Flavobacterium sp. HJJ]
MKRENKKILFWLCIVFACVICRKGYAQDVDLENFYKPNFKVTGNVNANTMYYTSNMQNSSEQFTYLLSGSLNISAFNFSVPLFYSITNQGNNLGYTAPFDFNRLSIMPKYKWVKAYIGNVSMTFSPYTLSGFPFKGVGLELTPRSPFKIALMGGQLLKAVSEENASGGIPVYQRFGYGAKIGFEQQQYKIGWIGFYAKDDVSSLNITNDKGVTPKENFVNSLIFSTSLIKNLNLNVEYALSVLTDDARSKNISGGNFRDRVFSSKESTSFMNALNVNFDYNIQKSIVGLTYERIDPNYNTLGALYFNNDLENIALRFARPFYQDKITVSTSLGYQRDDLAKAKKQDTKRVVGSINMNYRVTDQLNITGSYSNFSTYTNKKLDQFELINNPNVVQSDTLDYRQLSQNANVNMSYAFGKKRNQNLNFNYSIAGQANEQGGIIRKGQASTVQNYNLAHSVNFIAMKFSLNSSLNYTNNQISRNDNSSAGASVGASKKLFKDKLNTNFGLLYNNSQGNTNSSSVFGVKFNNSYVLLEKHSLNMSIISMFRSSSNAKKYNDLTAALNYSYSLDKIKLTAKKESKKEPKIVSDPVLKIKHKEKTYEGTRNEIIKQLQDLQLALRPMPKEDSDELQHLFTLATLTPDDESFKEKTLNYLKGYDLNNDILDRYNQYILETVKSLEEEMIHKDEDIENDYVMALGRVNKHKMHGVNEQDVTDKISYNSYLKLVERKNKKLQPLLIHRRMLNEISMLANTSANEMHQNENLSNFNNQELSHFFKMMKEKKTDTEIIEELKIKLIPFYHDLAIKNSKDAEVEFKYLKNN